MHTIALPNIGLWPKLYVTAIAALFFVFGIARWLANYLRPSEVNIGFGLPEPRRSRYRFALFSLLLAVCCILFIILAILLTNRFTLQLIEATAADTSAALLIAPDASVESVTIELPPKGGSSCDWKNKSQGDLPPLAIQMIGWNSPTPQLHIDEFVSPQRIEIECKPAHAIRAGILVPARTTIYLSDYLRTIHVVIIAAGGLIWLGACFAMWL